MKKVNLLVLLLVFLVSCAPPSKNVNEAPAQTPKDGLFVHISESYKDPHRLLMPLKMALMMSDTRDVLIYMDIHAVDVLIKDSEDISYGDFETAHTYIQKLLQKKVEILACPTCLKLAGHKPEELIEGVRLADKDKFFGFTKGRILTLDY